MTIRELALNWIENADTTPTIIDLETAKQYIGCMDPDSEPAPDSIDPVEFMEAWNDIING
jgi:hypothetical protein